MAQKLLKTAKRLTEDGGHGDKWNVFDKDIKGFLAKAVHFAVKNGEVIIDETKEGTANTPEGELPACLIYTDCSDGDGYGINTVCAKSKDFGGDGDNLTLISMFPKFFDPITIKARINEIELFPNALEARLWLQTDFLPFAICAFDTDFCLNRGKYEKDEPYEFHIFALAFLIASTNGDSFSIDDEDGIRKHRATRAWIDKHGSFNTENDLENALRTWEPTTKEDLEPIVFDLSRLTMLMAHDVYADESQYSGEILQVMEPIYVSILGHKFWRLIVCVSGSGDGKELEIPFFVSENLTQEFCPKVGDYIKGTAWLGCYLK